MKEDEHENQFVPDMPTQSRNLVIRRWWSNVLKEMLKQNKHANIFRNRQKKQLQQSAVSENTSKLMRQVDPALRFDPHVFRMGSDERGKGEDKGHTV